MRGAPPWSEAWEGTHRPSEKQTRSRMCSAAKRPKADSYGTVVRSHCTLLLTLLTKTRFVPILFLFPQLFLSTISMLLRQHSPTSDIFSPLMLIQSQVYVPPCFLFP